MIFFNLHENILPVGDREFMHSNVLTYDSSKFFFPNSNYLQMTVSNMSEPNPNLVEIKNVVFNPPATIVFWTDNSKTVVKAENEAFDPEKGLAMAIAKKALGNKGNYYNVFRKWLPKEEAEKDHKKTVPKKSLAYSCATCQYGGSSVWEEACYDCSALTNSNYKPMINESEVDDDNVL